MTQENSKSSLSASTGHILIIEADDNIGSIFINHLVNSGYQVKTARDRDEAVALVDRDIFDIALLDICTHDYGEIDLLKEIKKIQPTLEVIVCGDFSKDCNFSDVFKAGAADWISKPVNLQELQAKVERIRKGQAHLVELSKKTYALERIKEETEQVLKNMKLMLQEKDGPAILKRPRRRSNFPEIISNSKKFDYVLELVQLVAITDSSALITGESGTGKELIARSIHRLSNRAKNPFVPVNCGALTDTLIDSELFGHERGAFTGALLEKRGLVEEAEGGTLFLDEIDASSPQFQVKLLRILQEGEFKRVGSTKYKKADIRIIAATNVSLEEITHNGNFREDLYYRLNQFRITLPPLRDRIDDILLLSQHLLEKSCVRFSKQLAGFSPDVLEKFLRYTWPGNVRELENVVSQAVILASPPTIEPKDIPALTEKLCKFSRKTRLSDKPFYEAKNEFERTYFKNVLERTNGNISAASRFSKIDRKQLREKIRKFGITLFP